MQFTLGWFTQIKARIYSEHILVSLYPLMNEL